MYPQVNSPAYRQRQMILVGTLGNLNLVCELTTFSGEDLAMNRRKTYLAADTIYQFLADDLPGSMLPSMANTSSGRVRNFPTFYVFRRLRIPYTKYPLMCVLYSRIFI